MMARLNEPTVSMDTLEITRRKLMRQNRDLARANSTHLQRIRALEAENSKQLSEKLELRGRVIRLEKELESNGTSRVADHAMDIRTKLEAQLQECLNVLGDLGKQPPRKRHATSPENERTSKPRPIIHRSPPRKRPDETPKEAEIRAITEGRLPPLMENRIYPTNQRRTLDANEIMALSTEKVDENDSPELGPPPMSQFIDADTDPVKMESPSKRPLAAKPRHRTMPGDVKEDEDMPSPVIPVHFRSNATTEKSARAKTQITEPEATPEENNATPAPSLDTQRTSAKRKFGTSDTSEQQQVTASPAAQSKPRSMSSIANDRKNMKTLKELANLRRQAKERKMAESSPRKALSAKSTNEDVNSPRKKAATASDKPPKEDGDFKPKKIFKDEIGKDKPKLKPKAQEKPAVVVPVVVSDAPAPEPVLDIIPSTEPVPVEAALLSPRSPEPASVADMPHDTPPPANISSQGETSRPSRRARGSVSYAEPNLRDKMRRPGKELFDAVAGEGRHKSRTSSCHSEEPAEDGEREAAEKDASAAAEAPGKETDETGPESPLPEKMSGSTRSRDLTGRRKKGAAKRASSNSQKDFEHESDEIEVTDQPSPSLKTDTKDPYDFPSSDSSKLGEESSKPAPRRQSKSSRRLSSVGGDDFLYDPTEVKPKTRGPGRKRASMAQLPTEPSREAHDDSFDVSSDTITQEALGRGRRKSMML